MSFLDNLTEKLADWFMDFFLDPACVVVQTVVDENVTAAEYDVYADNLSYAVSEVKSTSGPTGISFVKDKLPLPGRIGEGILTLISSVSSDIRKSINAIRYHRYSDLIPLWHLPFRPT